MNKLCLITGATGGIGKALANVYASHNYDLFLTSTSIDKLNKLKEEILQKYKINIFVFEANLNNIDSYLFIYEEVQKLNLKADVLINNAGFGDFGEFYKLDLNKVNELLNVNIIALTNLTHLFIKDMIKNKSGKIVNVGSIASFFSGPYLSTYYASKNYVLSFSEAIDYEVKKYGVRVLTLCPGTINTGFEKRANLNNSRLFKVLIPIEPNKLAKYAYKKINKNKRIILCGLLYKFLMVVSKITPRFIVLRIITKIQKSRF
ncbi:MAG: SDR family oxidoreductase [Firmicutes bacterium]|uniref:SDR family oxidoreductase n=1 Tax=Candidatus Onthovivens merdipullorum TaxID=2840889 RepID=A0A9D9GWP2_9BACL|nr:SDR family oxidoreductase [Candidatus Onthovivens merdipullorum]